ncbi:MAG: ArsR family transcriptional regulator, partial [Synechococcaceae bacterium WBB_34_004]|nr:ArsR family transcriptional regulator [Synechococcaceae bacterium WBB_34_004]
MTESQILTYLMGRKTSVSVKELSQRFKKDPNCISIYLKRLMQQGLVVRKKSASKT